MANSPITGGNLSAVKRQNRSAVLRILLHHGPISRVHISQLTGVSTATITNIVDELLRQGYVTELGEVTSAAAGRRPILLGLRQEAAFVGAIDFRIRSAVVAIADLGAHIVDCISLPYGSKPDPLVTLGRAAAGLEQLLARHDLAPGDLLAVGIGCPGLVEFESGVLHVSPVMGWHNVPVTHIITERFGVPAMADNRARAVAVAEKYFGLGRQHASLISVYVGWGLGTGMLVDNQTLRGTANYAGELGHMVIIPGGAECECGSFGCLETVASGATLVAQAQQFAAEQPQSRLAELCRQGELSMASVLIAARDGDPDARALVIRMATYLGAGIANLVTVLNPGVIALCGTILEAGDFFMHALREAIDRNSLAARATPHLKLVTSTFGKDAEITGAAALALEHAVYDPPPSASEPVWRAAHGALAARPIPSA